MIAMIYDEQPQYVIANVRLVPDCHPFERQRLYMSDGGLLTTDEQGVFVGEFLDMVEPGLARVEIECVRPKGEEYRYFEGPDMQPWKYFEGPDMQPWNDPHR